MKISPFIKPIKTQGGTFYTFSSSGEDLHLSLAETNNKFRFSKFALLKIPMLKSWNPDPEKILEDRRNYMQLDAIPGAYKFFKTKGYDIRSNDAFSLSFQNYCLNLETTLTAQPGYKVHERRTVSERVFFKWLKETGAIRFREADVGKELTGTIGRENNYGIRYTEEYETKGYERVVKYIGDINVVNSVKASDNSYSEVFIHVPTSHGSTKDVLFASIEDDNYKNDMSMKYTPGVGHSSVSLYGRESSESNPAGLDNYAFYDTLENFNTSSGDTPYTFWMYDEENGKWITSRDKNFKWWYSNIDSYTYKTERDTCASDKNDLFAIGPNPSTDIDGVTFRRSRLDGISVDFDKNSYFPITNGKYKSLGEYNKLGDNFSFNTVLVYYDLFNKDNPDDYVTNLFGVLFLDNVDPVPGEGYAGMIPPLNKFKPSIVSKENGNSYAFKLNLKFDVSAQDTGIEVSVDPYNTVSMDLFCNALDEMRLNSTLLTSHINKYSELTRELESIRSLVENGYRYEDVMKRIDDVESKLEAANTVFANNDKLMELIERNYNEIKNIYDNKTSITLAYNLDLVQEGRGIKVDRTPGDHINIVNTNQNFNLSNKPVVTIKADFNHEDKQYSLYPKLRPFDNYVRIADSEEGSNNFPKKVDKNICIYVDDTDVKWERGQRFRISFENGLILDNENGQFNLYVYTDAEDNLRDGNKYSRQAAVVVPATFDITNNYKPIIEIICIDDKELTFVTDIF